MSYTFNVLPLWGKKSTQKCMLSGKDSMCILYVLAIIEGCIATARAQEEQTG